MAGKKRPSEGKWMQLPGTDVYVLRSSFKDYKPIPLPRAVKG